VPDGNSGKAKSLEGQKHSMLNYNPEIKENIDGSLSTRNMLKLHFGDHDNL